MSKKNLSAIVTGGASGIGEAIVRSIIKKGGSVGIIDLNIEKGKNLSKELGAKCFFKNEINFEILSQFRLKFHNCP